MALELQMFIHKLEARNYIRMEGAREFQVSLEYQIYCLFYCFGSSLKFKPCCQIWWQIQMDKSKVDGKASSCEDVLDDYVKASNIVTL